jgi:hypothetical protein
VADLPLVWWIVVSLAVAVASGLLVALTAPGVRSLIQHAWRASSVRQWWGRRRTEADAQRLLRAIRDRAERTSSNPLDAQIAIEKAADQAGVDDPAPALELLRARGQIVHAHHGVNPHYVQLTPKGLREAENAG